jgi:rhodanese-related sulfurtransferase
VETGEVGEEVSADGGSFTRVSPEELKAMMGRQDFPLVNVHIPFEGNIPGTDLSIPYNEIEQNLGRLPAKGEKVVLYCRSGSMSAEASKTLVGLGYTDVWDLGGGMIAWQEAGYRLEGV